MGVAHGQGQHIRKLESRKKISSRISCLPKPEHGHLTGLQCADDIANTHLINDVHCSEVLLGREVEPGNFAHSSASVSAPRVVEIDQPKLAASTRSIKIKVSNLEALIVS